MRTKNSHMSKLGLEKEETPEIKLPTLAGSQGKLENSRKTSTCFINYARAFDCEDHNKLWKPPKEMGIPDHLTCLQRNLYVAKKQHVAACVEQLIGSRLRKKYDRAVCFHPVCLIYTLRTSWEMLAWMSYKPESR